MEKRKAYIITALIILFLLMGLSFWYLYIAKEELKIGQVTELELYGADTTIKTANTNSGSLAHSTTDYTGHMSSTSTISAAKQNKEPEQKPEKWHLIQIHGEPVVGQYSISGIIQFIDKKTGHLFTRDTNGDKNRESGITLKQVNAAYVMPEGSIFVLHNNDTAPTKLETLSGKWVNVETELPTNMGAVTKSGDYLYFSTVSNSGGINIISTKNTEEVIWHSPLSQWLLQATDNNLIVTQKASYGIPGYSYMLPKQAVAKLIPIPIAQDLPGLTTLVSPDSKQLLYSTSGKGGVVQLYLKDLENKDTIPLSISTLASKCTWSNDSITLFCAVPAVLHTNLPDNWYKGQVSFADSAWRINSKTGDAFELAHETGLDIINIVDDAVNGVVLIQNKTDQSLWAIIKDK
jgi:hypothetical protein